MADMYCRYMDVDGICLIPDHNLCNKCLTGKVKYTWCYDVYKNTTTIAIYNHKGNRLISCEIYGQLENIAVRCYAVDLCRILTEKGILH